MYIFIELSFLIFYVVVSVLENPIIMFFFCLQWYIFFKCLGYHQHGFNEFVSDKIGPIRAVPDVRFPAWVYQLVHLSAITLFECSGQSLSVWVKYVINGSFSAWIRYVINGSFSAWVRWWGINGSYRGHNLKEKETSFVRKIYKIMSFSTLKNVDIYYLIIVSTTHWQSTMKCG